MGIANLHPSSKGRSTERFQAVTVPAASPGFHGQGAVCDYGFTLDASCVCVCVCVCVRVCVCVCACRQGA